MTGTKQLLLTGKNGQVYVKEAHLEPVPSGHVRVQVVHSGISPGTELLALDRSLNSTREFNMGYQAAGIVEALGSEMENRYKVGDRVACYGGPYVYHASHLNVPRHLVTPLPDNVPTSHAAFCAMSSIALHGFRMTGCHIGETVAVIGLGLLGNIAAQCAKAAGCQVICSELLPRRIKAAAEAGLEIVGSIDHLKEQINTLTASHGADAVILAVKNTDNEILANAYQLVRRLGKIVILGLSDAQLPRELMFSTEASLVVSRAAGWGRYSKDYEFDGRDLPYEHARWTEGRNLTEAIRLINIGSLKIDPLITDEIHYTNCQTAYSNLKNSPAEHLAVVLNWKTNQD